MRVAACLLLLALSGCVGAPTENSKSMFDFGLSARPAQVRALVPGTLAIARVSAPAWLATQGIVYRLAYENAAQPQVYSHSRWVAPADALVTERLQQILANVAVGGVTMAVAGVATDYQLRVDLEEFSQVFDARDRSHALVRMRASLVDPQNGNLLAQANFHAERPAAPNAQGAAHGLRDASDEVLRAIADWLVVQAPRKSARK